MWPFSSSVSSSYPGAPAPSSTLSASSTAFAPDVPSTSFASPPPPPSKFRDENTPLRTEDPDTRRASAFSSVDGGPPVIQGITSKWTEYDTNSAGIVAAGVAAAVVGPDVLRLKQTKTRGMYVLGVYVFASYLLVQNLLEKFKSEIPEGARYIGGRVVSKEELEAMAAGNGAEGAGGVTFAAGNAYQRGLDTERARERERNEREGGFGGQESLKDKYATTSGEH